MNSPTDKLESRRGFLRASGRYLVLGSLTSLVVAQDLKRRRQEGDPDCIKLNACRDCTEFQGCRQPKAERFRGSVG